jgi:DNA-binding IclR family transcriptional regulator
MENQNIQLTRVAQIILKAFEEENRPMKPEELVEKIGMKIRSVRYGLKLLLQYGLVMKYPDLTDLRTYYFQPVKHELDTNIGIQAIA